MLVIPVTILLFVCIPVILYINAELEDFIIYIVTLVWTCIAYILMGD